MVHRHKSDDTDTRVIQRNVKQCNLNKKLVLLVNVHEILFTRTPRLTFWRHKNIARHTAHTIVSWPNTKQWQPTHTSNLMVIIMISILEEIYVISNKRPVMRASDIFFVVSLKKLLQKQSRCWWFETPWCACDVTEIRLKGTEALFLRQYFKWFEK